MRVGVIDYGVGNLGSVLRALDELRVTSILITRAVDMDSVDSLILPGVGSFADCAGRLAKDAWSQALRDQVLGGHRPLLGVCVGMQLLASCSLEGADKDSPGAVQGLGFVPGRVEHLRALGCTLRVPHVGWNEVVQCETKCDLLDGIPDGTDFYFVHSYAFVPDDPADLMATTDYGVAVAAAVGRGRIWGTQFHPEKSSRAGLRLLQNFIEGPVC